MGNIFSGSEIVEIGIQIEHNGFDFYNTLSKKTKDLKSKDIFEFLAGEEKKHIAVFQGILGALARYEPPESYPGEYFSYMNALAGEYVFTGKNKGAELAQKIASDLEAINLGIGFEKDSIIFYDGMKKVVPPDEAGVIDQLIKQEEKHLQILMDLKHGRT